ncbi:MAG TPA: alanine racemase [Thermoanaerobaculia bacterium]
MKAGDGGPLTRARVDLSAIARNYRYLRGRAGDSEVIPVVKADAYGHGAAEVSRRLEREGARRFAVASTEEGLALRRAGICAEILLLNASEPADAARHRAYGLNPALYDPEQAAAFAEACAALLEPLPVFLKVDTGMGRLGFRPEQIASAVAVLRSARGLRLAGVFSNFAASDEPASAATPRQIAALRDVVAQIRGAGLEPGLVHISNSAGVLSWPDARFDAVRPGLALYGVPPTEASDDDALEPALTLETRVLSVRRVPEGTPLGYGSRFTTVRSSTIAVVPLGYHDGIRRGLSGRAAMILRGKKAPIVGAISMDLTLLDATETGVAPGDRVICLGRDGESRVTAWELARAAGTIPWEILCGIGPRVARVHE